MLFRIRLIPNASTCCDVRPLMAACVATGMKVGNIVVPSVEKKAKRKACELKNRIANERTHAPIAFVTHEPVSCGISL